MTEMNEICVYRSEPPLVVADVDDCIWSETADVVIVGFGGAGAAAAIQARECELDVIAVDRFAGGGATSYSGGVIYAGGTKYQRESGFNDTADEMFKYLDAERSAVSATTLRRFCDGSAADLQWLDDHGVPHGSNAYLEKASFPPDPHWLFYTGNEKSFAKVAAPAPRGHRTVAPGMSAGGRMHYTKLRESALRLGVRLIEHSPVSRMVLDRAGRVIGVEVNDIPETLRAEHQSLYLVAHPWRPFIGKKIRRAQKKLRELEATSPNRRLIRAARGVVLSTGGFIQNEPLVKQHHAIVADNFDKVLRLGSMADDGSGILLGKSVGGATDLMGNMCVGRLLTPPDAFVYGALVNADAQRFVSEGAYVISLGKEIAAQPSGTAWLVLEGRGFWKGVKQCMLFGKGGFWEWGFPPLLNIVLGNTKRAPSLEKLAKKLNVDAAALQRTVDNYSANVEQNMPDAFGKLPELCSPVRKGPFYAVNMSLSNKFAPAPTFTMGGLQVLEDTGAVARKDGSAIAGLYAAGRVAVGLCSNGYVSGLAIADTVFSGRRAARRSPVNRPPDGQQTTCMAPIRHKAWFGERTASLS